MHVSDLNRRPSLVLSGRQLAAINPWRRIYVVLATMTSCVLFDACATKPLIPFSADTPPMVLMPASQAGVVDKRGRFREIYCAVLAASGPGLPDYQPCEDALTRVGTEPAGTGTPVELGQTRQHLVAAVVPGIGYDCFKPWRRAQFGHVQSFVDALSRHWYVGITHENGRLRADDAD